MFPQITAQNGMSCNILRLVLGNWMRLKPDQRCARACVLRVISSAKR
jgi:hypothetical protein